MSSSTTTAHTIAVAGAVGGSAGNDGFNASVGSLVVDQLLKTEAKVVVLIRSSSADLPQVAELKRKGVQIAVVDYSNASSLERALQGVDLVVSALAGGGTGLQFTLDDAAKAAGAKAFIPSEFGKDAGLFSDFIPFFLKGGDGQIELVGSDDVPVDFINKADVASYVAHVAISIPVASLSGQTFRLSGFRTTFFKLASYLKSKQPATEAKPEIVRVSVEDALTSFKEQRSPIAYLKAKWAQGEGVVRTEEQVVETRKAFVGWEPLPVEKCL
ncbi:NmrA-like [Phaffia rhodozyma]|uniref:NmrA-like n=1 Tax=Phaffia rhodozyma TaxID=264483 RepID=A0A0F7SG12_PHARH|nr:NmrA-like [Phaffia rhodozyma]